MDKLNIIEKINQLNCIDDITIEIDADMSKNTSFKIGGPADILVKPKTQEAIIEIVKTCKNNDIPLTIIGNGSNLLVKDSGIRGVVLKISNNYNSIEVAGTKVIAQSGATLPSLGQLALKHKLTGFEFAAGIPGTVGGAIVMNAGAHGGEMKDIVKQVKVINTNGDLITLTNEEMKFEYRKSILQSTELIVIEVEFELENGITENIKEKMEQLKQKRTTTQPLKSPNAGSTFRRPLNNFAGKLIEDAGLKGLTLGGAQVSTLHAGFIINTGNATANDILTLMDIVKCVVKTYYDIELNEEIKIIG